MINNKSIKGWSIEKSNLRIKNNIRKKGNYSSGERELSKSSIYSKRNNHVEIGKEKGCLLCDNRTVDKKKISS